MTEKTKKKKDKYRALKILSGLIVITTIAYGIVVRNLAQPGTFGDMFGGLTALFSGLAFAGIIYTILLQRKELKLQRKELKQTRTEFKTQNETLKKQRFENTFFNLLTQHNKIIETLTFSDTKTEVAKNDNQFDAFRFAWILLHNMASKELPEFQKVKGHKVDNDFNSLTEVESEEILDTVVKLWYNRNPHNLHLYFQSLLRILKFINKSNLLDNHLERLFYASLLKDQISYYEKAVILYVGLLPDKWYKGITYYVKKYEILEGIDERSLVSIRDKRLFDKWANPNEPVD